MTYKDENLKSVELQAAKLQGFIDGLELVFDHLDLDALDYIQQLHLEASAELENLNENQEKEGGQ